MNEVQRHHKILSLLKQHQVIDVLSITDKFNVSPATARRDIAKLDEQESFEKSATVLKELKKLKVNGHH